MTPHKIAVDMRYADLGRTGLATYCRNIFDSFSHFQNRWDPVPISTKTDESNHSVLVSHDPFSYWNKPREFYSLHRCARVNNFEIVHFTHFLPFPKLPCRVVATIHDLIPLKYPASLPSPLHRMLFRAAISRACRTADRIVVVSTNTKNDLCESFDVSPDRVVVVPNVVDVQLWSEPAVPGSNHPEELTKFLKITGPFFLHVAGRPKPHKNVGNVLQAFHILRARDGFDQTSLCLVGAFSPGHFSRVVDSERNRLYVFDGLSPEALRLLYQQATATLFPSLYEGFGLPITESMAAGTPVITSTHPPMSEIGSGGSALLIDPRDPSALAQAMERVLTDSSLGESLRTAGRKRAADFSISRVAPRLEQVYLDLV